MDWKKKYWQTSVGSLRVTVCPYNGYRGEYTRGYFDISYHHGEPEPIRIFLSEGNDEDEDENENENDEPGGKAAEMRLNKTNIIDMIGLLQKALKTIEDNE